MRVSTPIILAIATPALAQPINIDFGPADAAPPDAYRAAGGPGYWNPVPLLPAGVNTPILDAAGNPGYIIRNIGGTAMLLADDPATTGADQALLDDMLIGYNNPVDVCIWIEGLTPGLYEVLIYALTPADPTRHSPVRVDFANEPAVLVGGPWTGSHTEGLSYARHTVASLDGTIGLHSGEWAANTQSGINAIQIRPLPYCLADWNGDTLLNTGDFLAYLGDYSAVVNGETPTHANPDLTAPYGVINTSDFLDYLNLYTDGCD